MGCSYYGIFSILSSSIGTLFVTLALILPLWSTENTIFNSEISLSADFGAGVWGICNTLSLQVNESINTVDDVANCYYYYSSSSVDSYFNTSDVKNPILDRGVFDQVALCDFKDSDPPFTFPETIAFPTTPDKELTEFLTNVCSAQGKSALAFSVLSMVFGACALVFFLLGITCCRKNSLLIQVGHSINTLASVSALLAFILWLVTSAPLHSDNTLTHHDVSFYLEIVSIGFFLITSFLVSRHLRKGDVEQQEAHYRNVATGNNVPAPHNGYAGSAPTTGVMGTNLV